MKAKIKKTFIVKGFSCWKKVNDKEKCAFFFPTHMKKYSNSVQRFVVGCLENLKNQSCYTEKVVESQISQEIINNWFCFKASIDIVRWLSFQACPFRGHDKKS